MSGAGIEGELAHPPASIRFAGILVYGIAGFLAGLLELLFVPLRVGSLIVPLTVLVTIGSNAVLPWLGRQVTADLSGALAPFLGWLIAVAVFALRGTPEGDVILPGGSGADAVVGYVLLIAGFSVGLVAVLRTSSVAHTADRAARRSPPVRRR